MSWMATTTTAGPIVRAAERSASRPAEDRAGLTRASPVVLPTVAAATAADPLVLTERSG